MGTSQGFPLSGDHAVEYLLEYDCISQQFLQNNFLIKISEIFSHLLHENNKTVIFLLHRLDMSPTLFPLSKA